MSLYTETKIIIPNFVVMVTIVTILLPINEKTTAKKKLKIRRRNRPHGTGRSQQSMLCAVTAAGTRVSGYDVGVCVPTP